MFWLPGLFFPQSFLTSVLQNHSRKHQVPIDRLSFSTRVISNSVDEITHPPEDGVYITGMFFNGAKWSGDVLGDPERNLDYSECPILLITPTIDFEVPENDYKCPLYITSDRAGVLSTTGISTNFVVSLNIPTADPPSKWTLRGAALVLTTPY